MMQTVHLVVVALRMGESCFAHIQFELSYY